MPHDRPANMQPPDCAALQEGWGRKCWMLEKWTRKEQCLYGGKQASSWEDIQFSLTCMCMRMQAHIFSHTYR